MDQLFSRLFLGDLVDAESAKTADIQAIVTVCEAVPVVAEGIWHTHIPIPDEVYLPGDIWGGIVYNIHEVLSVAHNHTVLVHCRLGVSRAPAACLAYLIRCGWSFNGAERYIRGCRKVVKIHHETLRGVMEWAEGS